jgi:beta-lactamase superfamily II metal-dependent hydrolase
MKKLQVLSFIICTIFLLTGCTSKVSQDNSTNQSDQMKVNILNVGDADCIIITTQNKTVMIDTGEKENNDTIINFLNDNQITKIDYLILTHFDKDHIGGAPKIIKNFDICQIIEPDYTRDSTEYQKLTNVLGDKKIEPTILTKELSFNIDNSSFTIYPPLKKDYGTDASNEFSLVTSVTNGKNKFLFAGDAEKERLLELSSQFDLNHTFVKIPHHGKFDKNSEAFLNGVNAKYAVICCSNDNPPDQKLIDILNKLNTSIYLTSNGNVTCLSDGESLKIEQ